MLLCRPSARHLLAWQYVVSVLGTHVASRLFFIILLLSHGHAPTQAPVSDAKFLALYWTKGLSQEDMADNISFQTKYYSSMAGLSPALRVVLIDATIDLLYYNATSMVYHA
jgi:hypothetical protein